MDEPNNMNMGTVERSNGSSAGPIIGIIVILAIIILGGLYFWRQRVNEEAYEAESEETMEAINTQSESDDASSIEADLNNTDIDNLDAELNAS